MERGKRLPAVNTVTRHSGYPTASTSEASNSRPEPGSQLQSEGHGAGKISLETGDHSLSDISPGHHYHDAVTACIETALALFGSSKSIDCLGQIGNDAVKKWKSDRRLHNQEQDVWPSILTLRLRLTFIPVILTERVKHKSASFRFPSQSIGRDTWDPRKAGTIFLSESVRFHTPKKSLSRVLTKHCSRG